MFRGRRKLIIAVVLFTVVAFGVFSYWKQGRPYQDRFWSPNREFYVQKFSTWTFRRGAMPGQGSDAVDGYIRLFDKDGHLLKERFATFIRDIQPSWLGREVFLIGVADMDNAPWILPRSAQ